MTPRRSGARSRPEIGTIGNTWSIAQASGIDSKIEKFTKYLSTSFSLSSSSAWRCARSSGLRRTRSAVTIAQATQRGGLVGIGRRNAPFRRAFDIADVDDEHGVVRDHRAPGFADHVRRREIMFAAGLQQWLHDRRGVLVQPII